MSRGTLLAGMVLALAMSGAGMAQGAVVFHPEPVPAPCERHHSRLNARYVKQLHVLNNYPYKTWVQAPAGAYQGVPPVIDLMQRPCGTEQTNLYWQKGALLQRMHVEQRAAERSGMVSGGGAKGMILIFPKKMMNRPVKEFERRDVGKELARAE